MPLLRALLIALCLLVPGMAPDLAHAQDAGPSGTIQTEQNAQQDADIAVRIREILRELGGYEDVTVTVSEGIVRLRGTTNSLAEATGLDALVSRVEGVVAIRNEVTETTDIARRLDPAIERFMNRVEALMVQLPLAAIALTVFLIVVFIGNLIARARNPWARIAPNAFIADLLRTIVRLAFIVAAIVIALDIMNATALLSTILGAAGLIGLAIGFAVRDTVENFIASVMLSIRQPFRPNDVVEINGDQGKVIRLTSRATILLSFDGNHIRIPNATVFKSRIVNFSQNAERRFMFTITVDSHADLGAVREAAVETIQSLPFIVAEPAASVWLGDINDSGIELVCTGWIDQRDTSIVLARGEALRAVKHAIESLGVTIPDKTFTIRLDRAEPPEEARTTAPEAPHPAPAPLETAEVGAEAEHQLEKLIEAERADVEAEDLLRQDATKE